TDLVVMTSGQGAPGQGAWRPPAPPRRWGMGPGIGEVPYRGAWGAVPPGPPISRHSRISLRLARCLDVIRQRTDTRPCSFDKAPYLAALVASSCRTIASG